MWLRVCVCISGDYSHLSSGEWVAVLNAWAYSVCGCVCVVVRKSAPTAHMHAWLCMHETISTTRRAFRISAGWYRLAAKAFTCIVDNDRRSSCGCVRRLPYKVWDREKRWKVQNRVWKHQLFVFPAKRNMLLFFLDSVAKKRDCRDQCSSNTPLKNKMSP